MKPTNTRCRYQFQCPQCELYFWTDTPDWADDKQCPDCTARDRRKEYQRKARERWWVENGHLKGAVLEDAYIDAGGVDVLYLRATDAVLWKAYIKRGWEAGDLQIAFERVTVENTLMLDEE